MDNNSEVVTTPRGLIPIESSKLKTMPPIYTVENISAGNWAYDGPVVFNQHGQLNNVATKNKNPIFWVNREFTAGRDEMVSYIEKKNERQKKLSFTKPVTLILESQMVLSTIKQIF